MLFSGNKLDKKQVQDGWHAFPVAYYCNGDVSCLFAAIFPTKNDSSS